METDRRVRRTREMLQKALMELIGEHRYDAITIQDIVDRADIGRTTFYLHYNNKDELFMSCHEAIIGGFHSLHFFSGEELLSPEVPSGMIAAYRHLAAARKMLDPIFQGQDSPLILQRIQNRSAQQIEACSTFHPLAWRRAR
jgi:AcrR family transcriptional regulator